MEQVENLRLAMFPRQLPQAEMHMRHFDIVINKGVIRARPCSGTKHRHGLCRKFLAEHGGKAGCDTGDEFLQRRAGQPNPRADERRVDPVIRRARPDRTKHPQTFEPGFIRQRILAIAHRDALYRPKDDRGRHRQFGKCRGQAAEPAERARDHRQDPVRPVGDDPPGQRGKKAGAARLPCEFIALREGSPRRTFDLSAQPFGQQSEPILDLPAGIADQPPEQAVGPALPVGQGRDLGSRRISQRGGRVDGVDLDEAGRFCVHIA